MLFHAGVAPAGTLAAGGAVTPEDALRVRALLPLLPRDAARVWVVLVLEAGGGGGRVH